VKLQKESIQVELPSKTIVIKSCNPLITDQLPTTSKYLVALMSEQVAYYTGTDQKSLDQVKTVIERNRDKLFAMYHQYGVLGETYQAMQSVLGWNIIYDASNQRVIYPVSRIRNQNFGGHYFLFVWHTYFAFFMVSF